MNTLLLCCKNCCVNLTFPQEKITLIICGTIVLIVIIAIVAFLLWCWFEYLTKRRRSKKETTNTPTDSSSTNTESIGIERWFSLKKEYQRMALDYIWERALGSKSNQNGQEGGESNCSKCDKRLDPSVSCGDDTYLKYIGEFISQIDKKLDVTPLSEMAKEKKGQETSPTVSESTKNNNQ